MHPYTQLLCALGAAATAALGYLLADYRCRRIAYAKAILAAREVAVKVGVSDTLDGLLDLRLGSVPEQIRNTIDQHLGLLVRELTEQMGQLQVLVRDSIGRGETDRRASEASRERMKAIGNGLTETVDKLLLAIQRIERLWT